MHPLASFFEHKARLDQEASTHGRRVAAPVVVLPLLAEALNHCITCNAGAFRGSEAELEYLVDMARLMAILAVWECKSEWIESGLMALVHEDSQYDSRITLTYFAMLNHAACKIGADFNGAMGRCPSLPEIPG